MSEFVFILNFICLTTSSKIYVKAINNKQMISSVKLLIIIMFWVNRCIVEKFVTSPPKAYVNINNKIKFATNCLIDVLKAINSIAVAVMTFIMFKNIISFSDIEDITLKNAPILLAVSSFKKVVWDFVVSLVSFSKQKLINMFWTKNISI